LLELFPEELAMCATVVRESPTPMAPAQLVPLFFVAKDASRRVGDVLGTCCHIHGGAPPDEVALEAWRDPKLALELTHAVLSLCDPVRIAKEINLDAIADESAREEGELDGMESVYCLLAERFGLSPLEIPNWPYEALLSVLDTVSHIESERVASIKGERKSDGGLRSDSSVLPEGGVARRVKPRAVRRG